MAEACPSEERHLIHDDLLYRNVLVQDDRITGLFDWGCSLFGDHVADLAHLLFWAPWHPALDALDLDTAVAAHHQAIGLTVPDRNARVTACQLRLGLGALGYSAATGDPSVGWITDRIGRILDS